MSFSRPAPTKSFSVARVNKMLGRVYSIALAVIVTESLVNALGQQQYLNPVVFAISSIAVVTCVIGVFISQWFFQAKSNLWLKAIALTTLTLLATWPLHFDYKQQLPEQFQPWIWWLLGISAIAAGTTFRFSLGILYLLTVSLTWPLFKFFGLVGSGTALQSVQEALHLFIFAAIIIAMVLALRWEAGKTDTANQLAISSAVESARIDALELERSRLDALVHDSVLTTLLVASRATTQDQIQLAANSAVEAIEKLEQAKDGVQGSQPLTVGSFFEALELRLRETAPTFKIDVDRISDGIISSVVARALTEATLQAVDNSIKHAGNVSSAVVRLRGQKSGIKIVVSDDGKGFRPSKVPKDRIGISDSISARVRNVGGKVHINSSPGAGTQVVLEWDRND